MKKIGLIKALLLTKKADKMTNDERYQLQQQRLNDLVNYCRQNSPYFHNLYKDITDVKLENLPTTNKTQMMEHFDEWLTDTTISKQKVEQFMSDTTNVGKKLDNKYLVYTTSGSTGKPCIVLYDDTTINVSSAIGLLRSFSRKEDLKAFIKHGGKTIALFADEGFYLGCGSVKYNLRKMPWKKNKMKTCDVRKPTNEIVDTLNKFQPSMIGCYPNSMELLAREQEKGLLNIHPVIIMTGGEQLTDDIRTHLSNVFNCYVQTNYSCTEGGTVACECTNHHFHINDDWVIIEAVDENNQPVPYGTKSAKVLLTNLANKICPIIRFEITDRITIYDNPCSCGNKRPYLTLEGRTDDVLEFPNNIKIPPLSLYAVLKEIHDIERFQLIQHEDSLELRLISPNKQISFNQAKEKLECFLKQNNIVTTIYLSDEKPQCSPISGKFKHIISKHNS